MNNRRYGREGFMMNRRTNIQNGQKGKMWNEGRFGNVNNKWQQTNRFEYRRRRENEGKEKDVHGGKNKESRTIEMNTNNEKASDGKMEKNDNKKVHQEGSTSMESSNEGGILGSNRFTLLDSLINEEEIVLNTDEKKIVDEFLIMDENYGVENTVLRNEVKGVEYHKAIQDEYSLLCHKEKVEWLREGDRNTAYFHKTIKERVHRGRIMTIRNEKGVRFEIDEVSLQIVKHFEEFIGPDGYTSRFYKSAWRIVGKEASQAVREFFVTGKLLGEVNATPISLVPKILTPGKVSDFRPISCCNVLYKCICKIMTNRIKGVLGTLVNENQSAFIGGRQITDNILLAQELFRGYNRKQNVKKVSFKIDLPKAYDTISWEFLKGALMMFGFHGKMVSWIMTCVTSTKFSISINSERVGYFKGGRCNTPKLGRSEIRV
ncbi:RNA-directed DNA polymerase, eukaryota, reverse transcriptase zinc-binding domain protein [Tanacetum coccineum]